MRPVGTSYPRPYGTVEEAIRQLIAEVGGLKVAAEIIKKSTSTIEDYINPDSSTSLGISGLIALEHKSSENPAIHFLVRNFGYEIFKPNGAATYHRWLSHVTSITKEFSELLGAAYHCLSDDGDIDAFEARKILKELDEHLTALCALRADLVKCSNGEKITKLNLRDQAATS